MSTVSNSLSLGSQASSLKVRLLSKQAQFTLDLIVLTAAFIFSYLLRFDFSVPQSEIVRATSQFPLVLFIQFTVLYFSGVHKFIWRYIGLSEAKTIINAALVAGSRTHLYQRLVKTGLRHDQVVLKVIAAPCSYQ